MPDALQVQRLLPLSVLDGDSTRAVQLVDLELEDRGRLLGLLTALTQEGDGSGRKTALVSVLSRDGAGLVHHRRPSARGRVGVIDLASPPGHVLASP